jgi:hexokinase
MMKKYIEFIKEADETFENDTSKFTEVKDEIKSMIEKTIEKSGGEFSSFVDSFKKNPEDVKVEGFINDSDIYDFYLKWRNDIDEKLNDIKYFDQVPSKNNSFGLYEYVIKATEKAFKEFVDDLK